MAISGSLSIFLIIVGLFVVYIVMETAARRGTDSSRTNKLIEELHARQKELDARIAEIEKRDAQ